MKKGKIQVIFLALIIIMPLVFTTIVKLSDSKVICELAKIPSEEEQNEKQESEVEDTLDKFLVYSQFSLTISSINDLFFLEKYAVANSLNREILTPPPEYI